MQGKIVLWEASSGWTKSGQPNAAPAIAVAANAGPAEQLLSKNRKGCSVASSTATGTASALNQLHVIWLYYKMVIYVRCNKESLTSTKKQYVAEQNWTDPFRKSVSNAASVLCPIFFGKDALKMSKVFHKTKKNSHDLATSYMISLITHFVSTVPCSIWNNYLWTLKIEAMLMYFIFCLFCITTCFFAKTNPSYLGSTHSHKGIRKTMEWCKQNWNS